MSRTIVSARCGMALLLCLTGLLALAAGPREEQWKKVDDAVKRGLPKTAIEQLQPIIEAAMKDKAYPEAIKAIGKKIALEGNIQGNKPEEKITRLQAEIAKAPKEMVPVMDALLADWYWHYFPAEPLALLQRTATAQAPGRPTSPPGTCRASSPRSTSSSRKSCPPRPS